MKSPKNYRRNCCRLQSGGSVEAQAWPQCQKPSLRRHPWFETILAPPADIIRNITPVVTELAQAIATQIMQPNNTVPQAILLVGGGALTPPLPEILAQIMEMPKDRVAVRRPDAIEDVYGVTADFCTPDAVTPLGILKIAGAETLELSTLR